MDKICGIYKIKNDINDKVYIGQSIDCNRRWKQHLYSCTCIKSSNYFTKLHAAMREIGITHFSMEILEECEKEKLTDREQYYIDKYNSIKIGYNYCEAKETNVSPSLGEKNGTALLTEEDVVTIRIMYNNHIRFKDVYKLFQDIITKRGLQKVWYFETWKHVMPEVYTEENRLWHKTVACGTPQAKGLNNEQKACSVEEIQNIRSLRKEGLSYRQIAEKVNRSYSVVYKYCKQVNF